MRHFARVACFSLVPVLLYLPAIPRQAQPAFNVTGLLTVPAGTVVTLAERNGQEITITAPSNSATRLTVMEFSFPKKLETGTPFAVSVKKAPPGFVSVMRNASGNVADGSPEVSILCDLDADLVSRSTDDKVMANDATTPVIGGMDGNEGRYVAFVSYAKGLDGSTGSKRQIFWRDRLTNVVKMISVSGNREEGNGDSFAPAISADGRSVAFESYATNLVPTDTNNVRDVFVWNADTNTVTAVSDAPGGIEANAEAYAPTISGNGKLIAFVSSASNLTPGVDGNSQVNVFLKDMESGSVTLISRHQKTGKAAGGSRPAISEDGSRIAFCNYFPLLESDKNDLWDIYLWDRDSPTLKRLSLTSTGGEREQGDDSMSRIVSPGISGNGKFVTYSTTAGNVVPNDNNKVQDVFIVEVDTLRVSRLSLNNDGEEGEASSPVGQGEKISLTYDGKWAVFTTSSKKFGGGIVMKNLVTGETRVVVKAPGSEVARPDISRHGAYVVFWTSERIDTRFQSSGLFVKFQPSNWVGS